MKRNNQQSIKRRLRRGNFKTKQKETEQTKQKKMEQKKKNNILKSIGGLLLMPLFYALFLSDRAFSSVNPFIDLPKFKKWLNEPQQVIFSLLRCFIYSLIIFVLWLF